MIITPSSSVHLLRVPFDATYMHTKSHGSVAEQIQYFNNLMIKDMGDDFTFSKKDGMLRVTGNADALSNINYVRYKNSAFSNKWFYAFVKSIEYLSDNSTGILLETDVVQTWYFDVTYQPSLIIREHVSSDGIGEHTVPEGLELGEYKLGSQSPAGLTELRIVLATTVTNPSTGESVGGGIYGGTYSGSAQVVFPFTSAGAQSLNQFLLDLTNKAKEDAVTALYITPSFLVGGVESGTLIPNVNLRAEKKLVKKLVQPTHVDGYVPKNNKLFTDPYMFCYVHNNNGSGGIYPYEYFDNREALFEMVGTPVPNPIIRLIPKNYKGSTNHYDEGLSIGGYPLLSWNYDTYKGWLAQSGASTAISTIGSAVALGAGIISGGAIPIIGGAIGALSALNQWSEASKQPPQAKGNALSGSVNTADWTNDFFVCHKTIRAEYARIIDEFFTMYGYKVNRVRTPQLRSRPSFNYIQVNDLSISSPMPSADLKKFKEIFQKGITFWKSSNIGNYSLNNEV